MLKIKFKRSHKYIKLTTLIIFIAFFVISFDVNSQNKNTTLDSSLLKNILTLLNQKEGEKLMIFTNVSENKILWIKKNKPEPLWKNIKKLYNSSNDNIVSRLIPKKYTGKFLFNQKFKDVVLKDSEVTDKDYKYLRHIQGLSNTIVVDFFLILYNQKGDNCLINYHVLNNGEHFVFLKKINETWIIENKYEILE